MTSSKCRTINRYTELVKSLGQRGKNIAINIGLWRTHVRLKGVPHCQKRIANRYFEKVHQNKQKVKPKKRSSAQIIQSLTEEK